LIAELQIWLREQRAKLSKNIDTTKAFNYCLSRWDAFTRLLDDGRLCMSNNPAERLRGERRTMGARWRLIVANLAALVAA
jgi:Transposase IS66 family